MFHLFFLKPNIISFLFNNKYLAFFSYAFKKIKKVCLKKNEIEQPRQKEAVWQYINTKWSSWLGLNSAVILFYSILPSYIFITHFYFKKKVYLKVFHYRKMVKWKISTICETPKESVHILYRNKYDTRKEATADHPPHKPCLESA